MGKYIVRRLLQMIPVIIGATFIIFMMVFALPGDPTAALCGDRGCSPARIAAFNAQYNLGDPWWLQYIKYLGQIVRGDLGETFAGVDIREELGRRFPITTKLAVMAILVETVVGIVAGIFAGIRKGKFLDNLVLVSTLFVIAVPIFVIGSTSSFLFGVKFPIFPIVVGGDPSYFDLLLPALVLGSTSLAYVARLTRTNLVENLRADYVRTATAKGLTRQRAIGVHAMRNSMIPVVTFIGADFGALLGGALVTETIFAVPGVGNFLGRSIRLKDSAAVVGTVVVLVLVYLVMNLLVDLLYGVLDPRISND